MNKNMVEKVCKNICVIIFMLLVYLFMEYTIIPKVIEQFLYGDMIDKYVCNILATSEKNELLEFVNRNNYGEYVISDIQRATNGEFEFVIRENEEYKRGTVSILKVSEGFIPYMKEKFREIIVFDIVTIATVCLNVFGRESKGKQYSYKLLMLAIGGMPFAVAVITGIILCIFLIGWLLGNFSLIVLKYGCILFCMWQMMKEILHNVTRTEGDSLAEAQEIFVVTVKRQEQRK